MTSVAIDRTGSAEFSMRAIIAPLAAIILGTFMAILDNTVVNVAFPTLRRVFGADLDLMQWVITGYLLAQAAVIPLAGWLSDRFGAKQTYLTSLALFTIGSMACAAAPTAQMLVLFRVLQGMGGGMLFPVGMAFLFRLAPPEKRGQVMGAFGIPVLIGPALGPILSGWLVQYADWRFIFLINAPIGFVAVLFGIRALPRMAAQREVGRLDLAGAILGPLAFASLTYGISRSTPKLGQTALDAWTSPATLLGLGVGLAALVAFIVVELRHHDPLLELRVFGSLQFSLGIVTQWVTFAVLMGALFLVPLFLQQVRGYGPFDTGLYLLPNALTAAIFMPISGLLFDRIGARIPALLGLVLTGVATWFLTHLTATTTGTDLLLPLAIFGAGLGLVMMPLGTYLLAVSPRQLLNHVTSLTAALQNVIGALAIAGLTTVLTGRISLHMAAAQRLAHTSQGPPSHPNVAPIMANAFSDTFWVTLALTGLGLVLAATLRSGRIATPAEDEEAPVATMVG